MTVDAVKAATAVNAAERLDRLPVSTFHRRIMLLVGTGMFFDGFDIYVAATVLGATLNSGFSTMAQNAQFMSVTFVGMMLGSFFHGIFRRSLRATIYVSGEPGGFRAGQCGIELCAIHDGAHLVAIHHGNRAGCGKRGGLFDDDGICAAEGARKMARRVERDCCGRTAGCRYCR